MNLQPLPIGYQEFSSLREDGCLYVDKTPYFLSMIQKRHTHVFLSRPRRFGKSLMLSTIDAMFSGKAELFHGLAAEEWVKEQSEHPAKVIYLDMTQITSSEGPDVFRASLMKRLALCAEPWGITPASDDTISDFTSRFLQKAFEQDGRLVFLVDEYDNPLLSNINDSKTAGDIRMMLRSFYSTVKACDKYLRFILITGITKFSKVGIFSGMNNLKDISMLESYSTICGYTQEELEQNFSSWIDIMAKAKHCSHQKIVEDLREYYDGFSFDGVHKVYNPWSVLNCLEDKDFGNYWYDTAEPFFLAEYLKKQNIDSPDVFRGYELDKKAAGSAIEHATPAALLYQSGFLTIVSKEEPSSLILDYPNREVLDSVSSLYIDEIYGITGSNKVERMMLSGLNSGNLDSVMHDYNSALSGIPCDYFKKTNEAFYCALFVMLLRAAKVSCEGEPQGSLGRPDIVVKLDKRIWIFEFKFISDNATEERIRAKLDAAQQQITNKRYAEKYRGDGRLITCATVVIDAQARTAVMWRAFQDTA